MTFDSSAAPAPLAEAAPAGRKAAPGLGTALAGARVVGSAPALPPPPPLHDNQLPRIAWVPLVVLLTLAARTLLWVLWPGTRIFPDTTATAISPQVVDGVSRA